MPHTTRPPSTQTGPGVIRLVAREYAIPAVVGTGNATVRLRLGQMVTVDGTAGTVTAHEEPDAHGQ